MHAMKEFGRDCCIRGYHVYKETWRAIIFADFFRRGEVDGP